MAAHFVEMIPNNYALQKLKSNRYIFYVFTNLKHDIIGNHRNVLSFSK